MQFNELLTQKSAECNGYVQACFDGLAHDRTDIFEAMRYSVYNGGKRLRMIVLLEAARLFEDNTEQAVPFACAVEMIHSYSLIHDDLPAMDNAELRRGKPCNHIQYGEAMAILAGDGLLHYAFELMARTTANAKEKTARCAEALNEIAKACGISGMLLGQALDVENETDPGLELLKQIYLRKTAAMFIGPMKAGTILAGASAEQTETAARFASGIGMAFQIVDDILDETGDAEKLGKNTGTDKKNNKVTVSSLTGIAEASRLADEYLADAKQTIQPLDRHGFFCGLCDFLAERRH